MGKDRFLHRILNKRFRKFNQQWFEISNSPLERGHVDSAVAGVCYSTCIGTQPCTPLKRGIAQGHHAFLTHKT